MKKIDVKLVKYNYGKFYVKGVEDSEESGGGSGSGGGATVGTLKTDNISAQTPSASESFGGAINLHKVSKTGSYNDLLNKPTILGYVVDLETFNIHNDGTNVSATTTGINNALKYAHDNGYKRVVFPKGTYLVKSESGTTWDGYDSNDHPTNYEDLWNGAIHLYSDTVYDLNGATFQLEGNNLQKSAVFEIAQCKNTVLYNGTIIGDRRTHNYRKISGVLRTDENNVGVWLMYSSNCLIENVNITECTGDCIMVSTMYTALSFHNPNSGCRNITIRNCDLSSSRRQGISLTGCFDTVVEGCTIHNIGNTESYQVTIYNEEDDTTDTDYSKGTSPMFGIDIEPWNESFVSEIVERVTIRNCHFYGNERWDTYIANSFVNNVLIDNCFFEKDAVINDTDATNMVTSAYNTFGSVGAPIGVKPYFRSGNNNLAPDIVWWDKYDIKVRNCVSINGGFSGGIEEISDCKLYGLTFFSLQSKDVTNNGTTYYDNGSNHHVRDCQIEGYVFTKTAIRTFFDNCHIINKKTNDSKVSATYNNCTIESKGYIDSGEYHGCKIDVDDFKQTDKVLSMYNCTVNFTGSFSQTGYGTIGDVREFIDCKMVFSNSACLGLADSGGIFRIINCEIEIPNNHKIISDNNGDLYVEFVDNIVKVTSGTAYNNPYIEAKLACGNTVINPNNGTNLLTFKEGSGYVILDNKYISASLKNQNQIHFATELWVQAQGYLTAHQDISNKENKVSINGEQTGISTLSAVVDTYHVVPDTVSNLAVTLPTMTEAQKIQGVFIYLKTGSGTPDINFTSSHDVVLPKDYTIEADTIYEFNCIFNGSAWVVAYAAFEEQI